MKTVEESVVIASPIWRELLPEGGTAISINISNISLEKFIEEYNKLNNQYSPELEEYGKEVNELIY